MALPPIDIYWSFRSPYSYLAVPRLIEIARVYEVEVRLRPVLPQAIRRPDLYVQVNPVAMAYLRRDAERVAAFLGIDFAFPNPDPVVFNPGTPNPASEQPYIYRLTRLGVAAVEAGQGMAFADEISRVIWDGKATDWYRDEILGPATMRAGLDLNELEAAVAADPTHFDTTIVGNGDALAQAGHWGVPTAVFAGEPFFGQDRLDVLRWRLDQSGVARA